MADVQIVCVHQPLKMNGKQVTKQADGSLVELDLPFNRCNRCATNWSVGDPEPKVVIAKLETI